MNIQIGDVFKISFKDSNSGGFLVRSNGAEITIHSIDSLFIHYAYPIELNTECATHTRRIHTFIDMINEGLLTKIDKRIVLKSYNRLTYL